MATKKIADMSDEELIDELVTSQREALREVGRHALIHMVVDFRTTLARNQLIRDAGLGDPSPSIGMATVKRPSDLLNTEGGGGPYM